MYLDTVRTVSLNEDETPDILLVRVEVKPAPPGRKAGPGWVARMTPNATSFDYAFLPLDRSAVNRAGNGSATALINTEGFYCASSQFRATKQHRTYFQVQQSAPGAALAVQILGNDIEHSAPETLRALEAQFGVSAARATARERQSQAEQVLADQLEEGRCSVCADGLNLEVTRLLAPPLTGSPQQCLWALRIRAADVQGFFRLVLARAAPKLKDAATLHTATDSFASIAALVTDVLKRQTSATYWIDRRPQQGDKPGERSLFDNVWPPTPEKVQALGLSADEMPTVLLALDSETPS
ncbi:hypothetical protein NVS55_40230 (plasmid) [Myxococcus stipitatus]|uniref:hypothetical protein n=1 Tax=Myxococcus stipitatus TaxID=83455 RepID=UPI003144FA48